MLQRPLEQITLAEFLEMMEGPQSVVACASHTPVKVEVNETQADGGSCGCEYHGKCEIRGLMSNLNSKVKLFLGGIRLTDLSESDFRHAPVEDALEP